MSSQGFGGVERNEHGVKVRADEKGDPFGKAHRSLDRMMYMTDIDGMIGNILFANNFGGSIFSEYAIRNNGKETSYTTVSIIERKKTYRTMQKPELNTTSLYLLDVCKKISKAQDSDVKFLYIIGEQSPWSLYDIDIYSRRYDDTPYVFTEETIHTVWQKLGIYDLYEKIKGKS